MVSRHDRLLNDIHSYLAEYGPCPASSVAAGLNPHYNGGLSPMKVAQLCKQLRGQGRVVFHRDNDGATGIWEAKK